MLRGEERDAARAAAQAQLEEAAAQYAAAIVQQGTELPAAGTYTDPASIYTALEAAGEQLAPGKLIKVSWLRQRAKQLGLAPTDEARAKLILPRRQDLERDAPEAFLAVDELRALHTELQAKGAKQLPVGALSYCWLSPEHPDPEGEQLLALAAALRRAQSVAGPGRTLACRIA